MAINPSLPKPVFQTADVPAGVEVPPANTAPMIEGSVSSE